MSNGHSIIKNALAQHPTPECELLATYATETANALRFLRDAFLNKCGAFPVDETNDSEQLWNAAMRRAYELVGRPSTSVLGDEGASAALQRQGVE